MRIGDPNNATQNKDKNDVPNQFMVSHQLTIPFSYFIYLQKKFMNNLVPMTQDLDAADTGGTSSMSNFRNASTMSSPLDGYVSATKPDIANSMVEQSSAIPAPYIQGGFTGLLLGVQQEPAISSHARKLYFDENM